MGRHAKYTKELVESHIPHCSNYYELAIAIGMGWNGSQQPGLRALLRKLGLADQTNHYRKMTPSGRYPHVRPSMPWGIQVLPGHKSNVTKAVLTKKLEIASKQGTTRKDLATSMGLKLHQLNWEIQHHGLTFTTSRPAHRRYPPKLVALHVGQCKTFYDLAGALGIPHNNAEVAKGLTIKYGLDTSHFVRKSRRGTDGPVLSLHPVGQRTGGAILFRELIGLGRPYVCAECNQPPEWNGKPLRLQVDHISGEFWDDREENLRFLCPNCHTQTSTYSGRGNRGVRRGFVSSRSVAKAVARVSTRAGEVL